MGENELIVAVEVLEAKYGELIAACTDFACKYGPEKMPPQFFETYNRICDEKEKIKTLRSIEEVREYERLLEAEIWRLKD